MTALADNKTFLKSKTIWGGILAVLPFVWQTLDIPPVFTVDQINEVGQNIFMVAEQLAALFLVVKGRIDAANDTRAIKLV